MRGDSGSSPKTPCGISVATGAGASPQQPPRSMQTHRRQSHNKHIFIDVQFQNSFKKYSFSGDPLGSVLIAHGLAHLGTSTETSRWGRWGQSTRATVVGHSCPCPVLNISLGRGGRFLRAGSCSETRSDILYQASFPNKNPIFGGTLKTKPGKPPGGRLTPLAGSLGSKAVEDGRLSDTPTARRKLGGKNGNFKKPS